MTDRLTEAEIEALSATFTNQMKATHLLERAGLARRHHPQFYPGESSFEFWSELASLLENGLLPDGRRRILTEAHRDYRGNRIFADAVREDGVSRGEGAPWEDGVPRHVSVFCLDARHYSRQDIATQASWREGLRRIVDEAVGGAGLPPRSIRLRQDRGDGFLAAVAADAPKAVLATEFVRELRIALRTYNRGRDETGRIRLRLALHQGEVGIGGSGFVGDAAVVAARLVDADPVRQLLEQDRDAELALVLSSEFYHSTVAGRLRDLDPAQYRRVEVSVAGKYEGLAWITLPGRPFPVVRTPSNGSDQGPVADGKWDFLISADPSDEAWGSWIARVLEGRGHSVHLAALDALPGEHEIGLLHEGISQSRRTLAVLSKSYLASEKMQAAWQADPNGVKRTLIPIRVETCDPAGLLRGISYIDLVDKKDGAAAELELVRQIVRSLNGRGSRPSTPPPFPGQRS
ncbi:toll/interleukin-1 receptor domain-containing protein [Frankia sp. BMG5.23]|uniref:toll/interleukin-1 receptor domain-containing protein n=1 Tax=Frankia sp. BMG5.23 TaxID=683305 RepID=UPI000460E097|nr:toll/interleukin-1 receptor domain-containing protein [Frankia sp. BMG5.23]KDA43569.1 family 3 adenylate cyclase [Frankia sp. BMG5.23]